ncbi:DUF211 domain-containing protein [Halorarius litoreus]|uniref:DUF211 domain-containing protein n=1 Tax=Halorarius litoreus TaxID=2962676 RepID=UPI0020CBFB2C|nr:DUF211 domain-containing protein [Halorarius litoreus]
MPVLRRVVVDVLKPHDPDLVEFADAVAATDGVDGVNATVIELDREVQNVKLTIEGPDLDLDAIEDTVDGLGGSVHSVDEVACGSRLVDESRTLQD